jgi:hypothetical protein
VEFYFSDSNLPKDTFLKGEVDKHPNGCEWREVAGGRGSGSGSVSSD